MSELFEPLNGPFTSNGITQKNLGLFDAELVKKLNEYVYMPI